MEKTSIPEPTAANLCLEISEEYQGRIFSQQAWRCWGCMLLNFGNLDTMWFNNSPGHRGCPLLNARFQQLRENELHRE